MLRDEDRMVAPRRLPSIVARRRGASRSSMETSGPAPSRDRVPSSADTRVRGWLTRASDAHRDDRHPPRSRSSLRIRGSVSRGREPLAVVRDDVGRASVSRRLVHAWRRGGWRHRSAGDRRSAVDRANAPAARFLERCDGFAARSDRGRGVVDVDRCHRRDDSLVVRHRRRPTSCDAALPPAAFAARGLARADRESEPEDARSSIAGACAIASAGLLWSLDVGLFATAGLWAWLILARPFKRQIDRRLVQPPR